MRVWWGVWVEKSVISTEVCGILCIASKAQGEQPRHGQELVGTTGSPKADMQASAAVPQKVLPIACRRRP